MTDNNKIQANSVDNNKIQASLTEQWKKGKLPEGLYWVKQDGVINILDDLEISLTNVEQILAPVPSYDEWKAKDDALTALLAEYGKLIKELQDEKEKHMTRPSLRSPLDEMVIEKQVWESTLHRSMVLQAENEQLKEALKECQEKILMMDYDNIKIEILQKINEVLK